MHISKTARNVALAMASIFAAGSMPTLALGQATSSSSASTADIVQMANTKSSAYVVMPAAERLAFYDKISRIYVDKKKKEQPAYANALETYLIPGEGNKGDPIGYEVYLRYVADIIAGKHAKEGVTGDTAKVYGSIMHVGNSYLDELRQTSHAALKEPAVAPCSPCVPC